MCTLRNLVSCGVYRLAHVDGPKFLPPAPMAALPGIFKLLQQKDTMIPLLIRNCIYCLSPTRLPEKWRRGNGRCPAAAMRLLRMSRIFRIQPPAYIYRRV